MKSEEQLRTWIEIDRAALRHNVGQFLRLIPADTRLLAVVKSNAYGHGLTTIATLIEQDRARALARDQLWFGVDSIVEGLALRKARIRSPILVLGHTLPARIPDAFRHHITMTVSSADAFEHLAQHPRHPSFHLKIDTGMHRQGFQVHELPDLVRRLKRSSLVPTGCYTHFAAANDFSQPETISAQLAAFRAGLGILEDAGFSGLIRHAAATGATLQDPDAHFDMIRIGSGIYGYSPSPELNAALTATDITLRPVLQWKTVIAETKNIPDGARVGYDGTLTVRRDTRIAVLPIGYWHGYDRGLSNTGDVLIAGRRAPVIGRVSMDMIAADITDAGDVRSGDHAALIGIQDQQRLWASELAQRINTTHYEFLTRLNPLIERRVV